ncbi:hypothetical protein AAL_08399 [Moelleriella libera RCEF 2490]|uniref:Uncharacterized protein n=1 Tax=Moelleriella libera RCEF 2490 TaxID=1081109 RepID=A0A167VB90_9HYPO|nr:hypothetical protein AAL_08399 [Moelleriella libera RCEF 2490]
MAMGLHRGPGAVRVPFVVGRLRSEARRRLWAAVLDLVLQGHLDSGAPLLLLSPEDCDTRRPAGSNDREEAGDESGIASPEAGTALASIQILPHRHEQQQQRQQHDDYMIRSWDVSPVYYLGRKMCVNSAMACASIACCSDGGKSALFFQLAYVGRASFKGPLDLSVILTLGLEGLMRLEHGRDKLLGRAEQARQSSIAQHLEAVRTRLLDGIRFAGRQNEGVSLWSVLLSRMDGSSTAAMGDSDRAGTRHGESEGLDARVGLRLGEAAVAAVAEELLYPVPRVSSYTEPESALDFIDPGLCFVRDAAEL